MNKVYQPIVIEKTEDIIKTLIESNFFSDHDIKDYTFAKNYLQDILTEKFIIGTLDEEEVFTEDEFMKCLNEILVGSVLEQLKNKGYVDSIEDDNYNESFFLTPKAKDFLTKNKNLL